MSTSTGQIFQDVGIEPHHVQGQPFGLDAQGREIRQVNGKLIVGAIAYMWEFIEQQVRQKAPAGLDEIQHQQRVQQAQDEALEQLVALLNASVPEERYHVSRDYLLNEGNNYSYEFEYTLCHYARAISGDENFFVNRSKTSIPESIAWIGRPFSLQQLYQLVPRLTAKFVDTDIRVIHTTPNSATIQWHGQAQAELVPEPSRPGYMELGCKGYQGAYASIPHKMHPELPPAQVRELSCQLQGDECCTWEFTWQNPVPRTRSWLWLGLVGTALLTAYAFSNLPGAAVAPWLALLPLLLSWTRPRLQKLDYEKSLKTQQALEQRSTAETQYDQLQQAFGDLQIVHVQLQDKIEALTDLHGQVRGATKTLNAAAAQIIAVTTQQAERVSEQSAAISETHAAMNEVHSLSQQAAGQAQEVVDSSLYGVQSAQSGQEAVEATIASMQQIKRQVEGIANHIQDLATRIQEASQIIALMSEFAAQSNLLALNAAVEAARAGAHGRGFAVVAGEVRHLAEQSQEATVQVRELLNEIQQAIQSTVTWTEQGGQLVGQGVQLATQSGASIEQLIQIIQKSAQTAQRMMSEGRQQAAAIEQIVLAIELLDQSTVRSLDETYQAEQSANNLSALAQQLEQIVQAR
ncbi:MAG: hypothetical protein JXA37_13750 [Chloroflexia bacterium]|nr:hypothetical protein [Chloroflexia bacterium]